MKIKTLITSTVTSLLSLPIIQAGEIHEWGTFTTVSGSNGELLTGLHVEEEVLPPFVYSHAGMDYYANANFAGYRYSSIPNMGSVLTAVDGKYTQNGKPIARPMKGMFNHHVQNVTVKMETPVIYFYGEERERYNIKVGFNGGTISQWYPQRKSGDVLPPIEVNKMYAEKKGLLDFSRPFEGSIEWDVEVIPRHEADEAYTFKPDQSLTWEYPRVPQANMVKVGKEYENYLFYRGIGNFAQPVKFTVDESETLNIKNQSSEDIPFVFAFENTSSGVRYKTLQQGVASGKSFSIEESEWTECDEESWKVEVFKQVRNGLLAQGLNLEESNGMVKTWWKSYFEHQGLRVFWVVPQGELEKVLPIQISPKPEKLVRVIVGRSDIMRPSFEKQMLANLKQGYFGYSQDRFGKAYRDRMEDFVTLPYHLELNKQALDGKSLTFEKYGQERKFHYMKLCKNGQVKVDDMKIGMWEVLDTSNIRIAGAQYKINAKGDRLIHLTENKSTEIEEIHLPLVLQ